MRRFTTAIIAAALIATAMTTADARPRKHYSKTIIITCDERGCSDFAAARALPTVRSRSTKVRQSARKVRQAAVDANANQAKPAIVSGGNHSISAVAERYVGTLPSVEQLKQWAHETGVGSWRFGRRVYCALGVNHVLAQAGVTGTGSALARSFYSWGRKTYDPRPGDVAVVRRNHVVVVVGRTARGVVAVSFNDHQHRILRRTYSLHGPQFRTAS